MASASRRHCAAFSRKYAAVSMPACLRVDLSRSANDPDGALSPIQKRMAGFRNVAKISQHEHMAARTIGNGEARGSGTLAIGTRRCAGPGDASLPRSCSWGGFRDPGGEASKVKGRWQTPAALCVRRRAGSSLDHLVGAQQHRLRHGEVERLEQRVATHHSSRDFGRHVLAEAYDGDLLRRRTGLGPARRRDNADSRRAGS